jgi:hypothetical protein
MTVKVLVGGLLAGILAFCWGAVAHMVFQLGDSAIRDLPDEEQFVTDLSAKVTESGVYFFPGPGEAKEGETADEKAQREKAWEEKYKEVPAGFLFLTVAPGAPMSPTMLIIQFLLDLGLGLIAAYMLARAAPQIPSYLERALYVSLLGIFASLAVLLPHWNWYGFGAEFTLGGVVEQLVKSALMGLLLALIIRGPQERAAPATVA